MRWYQPLAFVLLEWPRRRQVESIARERRTRRNIGVRWLPFVGSKLPSWHYYIADGSYCKSESLCENCVSRVGVWSLESHCDTGSLPVLVLVSMLPVCSGLRCYDDDVVVVCRLSFGIAGGS
jgi:hypothetical protein